MASGDTATADSDHATAIAAEGMDGPGTGVSQKNATTDSAGPVSQGGPSQSCFHQGGFPAGTCEANQVRLDDDPEAFLITFEKVALVSW